jgi:hypothetical protein
MGNFGFNYNFFEKINEELLEVKFNILFILFKDKHIKKRLIVIHIFITRSARKAFYNRFFHFSKDVTRYPVIPKLRIHV